MKTRSPTCFGLGGEGQSGTICPGTAESKLELNLTCQAPTPGKAGRNVPHGLI